MYPIIQAFEQDEKPFFVLYGDTTMFQEVYFDFHSYLQASEKILYLSLDVAPDKNDALEKICFEIVQQLVNSILDSIPESDEHTRLSSLFRILWNLQKKTREYETERQLAEFIRFTRFSCFPILRTTLYKNKQPIIIGLQQFEKITGWENKVYNFILENLLDALEGVRLRFVVFVRSDQKPNLFYGSNEEGTRERILFYKVS